MEEALGLSFDRLLMMMMMRYRTSFPNSRDVEFFFDKENKLVRAECGRIVRNTLDEKITGSLVLKWRYIQ